MENTETPNSFPGEGDPYQNSIYSVGLVSINFTRLESAIAGLFVNVIGTTVDFSYKLMAKTKSRTIVEIIKERILEHKWPADIEDRLKHFVSAFKTIADNRNIIIHSNILHIKNDYISLYHSRNDGKTVLCDLSIGELNLLAQEIQMYTLYCTQLCNHIGMCSNEGVGQITKLVPPGLSPFPLPEKPLPPTRLGARSRS